MAPKGRNHFERAYALLRDRLGRLHYRPGVPIAVVDIADALCISHTPVREALARLAGEHLVDERRGDGYFAPGLTANDIGDLYAMRGIFLDVAITMTADPALLPDWPAVEAALDGAADAVATVLAREVFVPLVAARGSPLLLETAVGVAARLAGVERIEAMVLQPRPEEVAELLAVGRRGETTTLRRLLKRYHRRRTAAAVEIAGVVRTVPKILPI